jgi:putative nucleotidyltransferase with HDIG domain
MNKEMSKERARILIVDDEKVVRRVLHDKLTSLGYPCQEAGNAREAIEQLKSAHFGLVILDIMMPGKSGAELLPEIKANYPDMAAIIATAVTDTNIAIQCMKNGAYDYVNKPFNLDEVAITVDRALEKRRLELENRDYQQHLEQMVTEQAQKIRASHLNAIAALAYALEAKDWYTSGHSQRVAEISANIAKAMGISQAGVEKIRVAGLIHDIGKIGVRESVLNKPSQLTMDEYQHIRSHSTIGERILSPIVEDRETLLMVRHHHEHCDGTGYPDGLVGEQIPVGARILAVADAYDAMTSIRPYRDAMSIETAYTEIEQNKGTHFDSTVVDAFLVIKKGQIFPKDAVLPRTEVG